LKLFAYHGVNPAEKREGQYFLLDIEASLPLEKACLSDSIGDTVSYAAVIKTVSRVFALQPDDLIERAAQRVADALLAEYPPIERVFVRLKKPDAPIKADFAFVAVEIERTREAPSL